MHERTSCGPTYWACAKGTLTTISISISISVSVFTVAPEGSAFYGGAVYCHKGAHVNIFNSEFVNNKTTAYGGVIYQLECRVSVARSNFSHNEGKLGGVLYHDSFEITDALKLEDCYFYNNRAERGDVTYISNSNVMISRCQFSYNVAREHGGVLFLTSETNATISTSNFSNNIAYSNNSKSIAGAVRAINGSQVIILHYALFENNSAYYGVTIYISTKLR